MRILEELFFGNINPSHKFVIKDSSYDQAMEAVVENEELLLGLLEGKEKKLFLKYIDAQSTVLGVTTVEDFICGFKLGAQIALAILSDTDENFEA